MGINSWIWKELSESDRNRILSRSEIDISEVKGSVAKIIDKIRTDKDKALYSFTKEFDRVNRIYRILFLFFGLSRNLRAVNDGGETANRKKYCLRPALCAGRVYFFPQFRRNRTRIPVQP